MRLLTAALLLSLLSHPLDGLAAGTAGRTAAAKRPARKDGTEKAIRRDLSRRTGTRFDPLLSKWQKEHGTRSIPALMRIAADRSTTDSDRYIAVLATARLGGAATAKAISTFLSDKSWMVRTAALRALTALKDPAVAPVVLQLLKDPALVVRNEAVVAAETLRPAGTVEALVAAIQDEKNYHRGRAQWVPQNALDALVRIGAPGSVAPLLIGVLERKTDPDLLRKAIHTFERLTGTKVAAGSLEEQVRRWKATLASSSWDA